MADKHPVPETVTLEPESRPAVRRDHAELEPGQEIDRYIVRRSLGSGGMGAVYAAFDPGLEREVAIKVVKPGRGDDDASARLVHEARALAKLSHPHIVAVHDVGRVGDSVFLAMELVEGETAREWQRRHAPEPERVVDVMCAVADGHATAHAAGIVHRDVKPQNILIDREGQAYLADFGVARAGLVEPRDQAADASPVDVMMTRTGMLLGTPAYMSPEQHDGARGDAKSDQFAFFVTLYELVYGERPFEGATVAHVADSITSGERRPVPPGVAVSARVRRAIDRGLQVDPDARFPSMRAARAALRPPRRGRRVAAALVVAGLGIGLGIGALALGRSAKPDTCAPAQRLTGVWDDATRAAVGARAAGLSPARADIIRRASARLDRYAGEWAAAYRTTCEAHERGERSDPTYDLQMACLRGRRLELASVVESLSSARGAQRPLDAAMGLSAISDCTDVAALARRVPLPAEPKKRRGVLAAYAKLAQVRGMYSGGTYRPGLTRLRKLEPTVRKLAYPPLIADVVFERARFEHAVDDAHAMASLREAARLAAVARDDKHVAFAWLLFLGRAIDGKSNRDALRQLEGQIPIIDAAVLRSGDDALRVMWLRELGRYWLERLEPDKALAKLRAALAHGVETLGPDHPILATAHGWLCNAYRRRGDRARAEHHCQRALSIDRASYGPNHPNYADRMLQMGLLAKARGDLHKALDHHRTALRIYERASGPNTSMVAIELINLSNTYRALGRHAEAVAAARRALRIRKALYGERHAKTAAAMVTLASAFAPDQEADKAPPLLSAAIEIFAATLGADHPTVGAAHNNLATLYTPARCKLAVPHYRRAIDIYRAHYGKQHPSLAVPRFNLAQCLSRLDHHTEALAQYELASSCGSRCPPQHMVMINAALGRHLVERGVDRKRGLGLVRAALTLADKIGAGKGGAVQAIRAWLREHD